MLSLYLRPSLFHITLMYTYSNAAFMCASSRVTPASCGVTLMCPCMCIFTAQCLRGVNTLSLSSLTVVLLATSPAYFRGFTLIALKEGREGTTDDDYTGQFQVRMSGSGEDRKNTKCALSFPGKFAKKMKSFACTWEST